MISTRACNVKTGTTAWFVVVTRRTLTSIVVDVIHIVINRHSQQKKNKIRPKTVSLLPLIRSDMAMYMSMYIYICIYIFCVSVLSVVIVSFWLMRLVGWYDGVVWQKHVNFTKFTVEWHCHRSRQTSRERERERKLSVRGGHEVLSIYIYIYSVDNTEQNRWGGRKTNGGHCRWLHWQMSIRGSRNNVIWCQRDCLSFTFSSHERTTERIICRLNMDTLRC